VRKYLAKFLGRGITSGKPLSVNLAQTADKGVSVFVADFAIVVAVAIVETCLTHAVLSLCPQATAFSRWDQMAILRRNTSQSWPLSSAQESKLEPNIFVALASYSYGSAQMPSKNERVELEMKIMKARQLARAADDTTRERLEALAAELEQKLREIDE
jgi:hypothetical protein